MIDEADRILEANFEEEMKQIIKRLPKVNSSWWFVYLILSWLLPVVVQAKMSVDWPLNIIFLMLFFLLFIWPETR